MKRSIENAKTLINDGCTIKQIADNFGISCSGLRRWLKKNNLKTKMSINRRTWSDEMLVDVVKNSLCIADVIRGLGLSLRPGNYPTVNKAIARMELDISHFKGKSVGRRGTVRRLEDVMVEGSEYSRSALKRRLYSSKMIENKCDICGIEEWNNKPIVMVLDHINGVNNDHRKDNLRMLCPNCNSQQDTFCGRNILH